MSLTKNLKLIERGLTISLKNNYILDHLLVLNHILRTMETSNKEHPYLFVYRDLELDKDINPIYSFRFVSKDLSPETNEVYLGSFGSQEVLEVLEALNSLKKASPKTKKAEMDGFEL
jgi:hypothetical protein